METGAVAAAAPVYLYVFPTPSVNCGCFLGGSVIRDNLDTANSEMEAARDALYASQRGAFETWYAPDRIFGLDTALETIDKARVEAAKR